LFLYYLENEWKEKEEEEEEKKVPRLVIVISY